MYIRHRNWFSNRVQLNIIMKNLLSLLALVVSTFVNAQPPTYDDLRILYADGNFEKLVKSATNYTEKDKTKTDPLPQLWLARGFYKLSLSGNAGDDYKNAYKDAIGAVGKCIKLDKSGAIQKEYSEFFDQFKTSLVEVIGNDISIPDYKKASAWVLKYYKLDINSIGAKYLEGACKFRNADKSGANTCWKDAETKLAKVTSLEDWSQADIDLLKMGVLQTADCYVSIKQVEKAKTLLGKVAQWFEEDKEFKEKYDAIVN